MSPCSPWRALALLLLCVTLPCYVWFAAQQGQWQGLGQGGASQDGLGLQGLYRIATPAPASAAPYLLLNESQPPPLEELAGLAPDDADTLVDLRPFRWILGGEAPGRCSPLVLVLVHTALDHAEHRRLIRETWGSPSAASRGAVMVRFLVGQPAPAPPSDAAAATAAAELQRRVTEEAAVFGDLVQGSFVDAYRNMTYKHAMALKWFATRCPNATYLLKVDDDVLVNTPVLLDFVRHTLSPFGARRLLACTVLVNAKPKRTWRSKWRVGFLEYGREEYPTYCAGWAVLYSPDVAFALYREAQRETYFWIDDVLVTGVLVERLGLTHVSWETMVMTPRELPRVLAGEQRASFVVGLWADVDMGMEVQRPLWRRIVQDYVGQHGNSTRTSWSTPS